ncbi:hypothetical protein BAUCODRAFT_396872 [Baudoinia panamericana UAMH 10762]|uniref:Major facilitator superfamily (MFS) profile domain-containing protein n=1 Tax=Baudoinia panamericana (strain UAMH 10762) TaxID=717646 RepID=M2NIP8_BAUPA|nr:uncharacterized protein BAUCODRAFT_396872 [Baudoinia panamericana UAMH 10762]EMC99269.1 hypothetical protein BAUCODRAFT_396872 [Baudoinia panamericana UAMH 10762]
MASRTAGGNAAFRNFHNDYLYIADPNERRRLALNEIDQAPFGWSHVRSIVVTGMGFFTDCYDIFAIGLVTNMLAVVYFRKMAMPAAADTAIKVATGAGNVVGQITFGLLADIIGRKRMYGIELLIIIWSTLANALSSHSEGLSIVGVIIFWRVAMGVGIGGDYPLSAVICTEFASTKWRGAIVGSVFAMQGLGQFGAAIVSLITVSAYRKHLSSAATAAQCDVGCTIALDKIWRIIIGFAAIPGCLALYYRLTIPETPRYTFDIKQDIVQAGSDIRAFLTGFPRGLPDGIERAKGMRDSMRGLVAPKGSWRDFWRYNLQWKHGKVLLGTAGSWFFLDVAFYGVTLNNATFLSEIGYAHGKNLYQVFSRAAVGSLIIVCAGAIPGYWVTVATVDTIGRKPIQLMGFVMVFAMLCVMGFGYHAIGNDGLLACYIIAQFFFNFGPNATTFIVPGECFPTRYRSTSHGISAAAGKVGSIVAQCVIGPLRTRGATRMNPSPWLNHVIQIFALPMLLGIFTTLLIPETKRRTLEDLANERPIWPDHEGSRGGYYDASASSPTDSRRSTSKKQERDANHQGGIISKHLWVKGRKSAGSDIGLVDVAKREGVSVHNNPPMSANAVLEDEWRPPRPPPAFATSNKSWFDD